MSILFLLLLLAAEEPVVRGRLCVETQCTDTTGRVFAVTPEDRARRWVWTSADASTVQLGVIPPKGEQAALDAGERTQFNVTIAGARAWPLDVQADVRGRTHWQWTVSAPQKLRRLVVPRGRYAIQLRAEHHRAFSRVVDAGQEKVNVGELALLPLPLARGTVVDVEGKPIAGALVSDPEGELCTLADAQGAFACELEEPLRQEALVVSAAGYGERQAPLPRAIEKDVDLGRIELAAGRRIHVRIVRPQGGPATVALHRTRNKGTAGAKLKTRELKEQEEDVQFDAGAGEYAVLVSGSGPLERLELPVEVKDLDVSETITIVPYRLEGTVRIGDEPLAAGELGLSSRHATWRGSLNVLDGAFAGTLWQSENVHAHLSSRELVLLDSIVPPPLGADPTRWDIRFENKLLTGRVFDAATEAPIGGADLRVRIESPQNTSVLNARTAPDGTYRINATRAGRYTLSASSRGYMPAKVELTVTAEDEGKRTANLALERGSAMTIEVVSPSGRPLSAWGYERTGNTTEGRVDREGRFTLRARPGEQRLLYVVPEQGSFAVVRVTIPKSDAAAPLRVVVPEATSALRVSLTRNGQSTAMWLLLRHRGEFVPGSITRSLAAGAPVQSAELFLPRLPSGSYELWAVSGGRDEEELIASNGTSRAPVRVELTGGESAVRVDAPSRRRE